MNIRTKQNAGSVSASLLDTEELRVVTKFRQK